MKEQISKFVITSSILVSCAGPTATPDSTQLEATQDAQVVTLVAYESFTPTPGIFEVFTQQTGIKVEVAIGGDTGALLTSAELSAGNPQGDVLWGIDSTMLSRAIESKIFTPYQSANFPELDQSTTRLVPNHEATPVDTGDVCINYDVQWFKDHKISPPLTLRDLTSNNYANMLVAPDPVTSSPGMAFMLATIAEFGEDDWITYWQDLKENGVLIVKSWMEAYYTEFSGSSGKGEYPLVVSYGSSPPAEMIFASPTPKSAPTAIVALSCYRQVEFAGILRGTENLAAAKLLIDFLSSTDFQNDLAMTLFVYPTNLEVDLPEVFSKYSLRPESPLEMDPKLIAENRLKWLTTFTDIILR